MRTTSHHRLLTLLGVALLAGFLHGSLTVQVLHDVSRAHSSQSGEDPDPGCPGGGAEIAAPCAVCSSVPARALPTDFEAAIPTLEAPALSQAPMATARWDSTCLVSFEARAPPAFS